MKIIENYLLILFSLAMCLFSEEVIAAENKIESNPLYLLGVSGDMQNIKNALSDFYKSEKKPSAQDIEEMIVLLQGISEATKSHENLNSILIDAVSRFAQSSEIQNDDDIAILLVNQEKAIEILFNAVTRKEGFVDKIQAMAVIAEYLNNIRKKIIPDFQRYEVTLNVMPPRVNANSGLLVSGMDPKAITDPATRKAYEKAIAENSRRNRINKEQYLFNRIIAANEDVFLHLAKRFADDAKDMAIYKELLSKSGCSEKPAPKP